MKQPTLQSLGTKPSDYCLRLFLNKLPEIFSKGNRFPKILRKLSEHLVLDKCLYLGVRTCAQFKELRHACA